VRPYEIVIIFDAETEDDGIRSIVDRTQGSIEKAGGESGRIDNWGKRRFAYELKHRWEGSYMVLQARAEPATMAEVDRALSLTDEVLRHRIVRIPEETWGPAAPAAAATEA
jgi:small subunit ribosomal protein S6